MSFNSRARKAQSVRISRHFPSKKLDTSVKPSVSKEPAKLNGVDLDRSETLVHNTEFATFKCIVAQYKLSLRPIGSGTFAVVYKGIGVKDGKTYALKFIDKKVLD
ncbi:hypothetical protein L0F63_007070, partial [Massospora cicadina]